MALRWWFCFLALACSVFSFGQYDSTGNPVVQWRTYREGTTCAVDKFQTRILVTEGDFQRYWIEFCGNRQATAPTDIDWNTEIVAAVHLGKRSTAGHRTYVETCQIRNGQLQIYYVDESPRQGVRVAKAQTSPYVMIRMKRTVGVPKFIGRTQVARITIAGNSCSCRNHTSYCVCGCSNCAPTSFPHVVNYMSFDTGTQCETNIPSVYFITSENQMFDYWCNMLGKPARDYRRGSIDFTSEVVIGIHLGQRSTGGYGIRITDFEATEVGRATLRYSEIPPKGIVSQVITSPYTVVVAPKYLGQIRVMKNVGVPFGK